MNPRVPENIQRRFQAIRAEAARKQAPAETAAVPRIQVGFATCGIAAGALETLHAFEAALAERKLEARIHKVGCLGHCYAEPLVVIDHPASGFPPILYHEVNPGKAKMLVKMFLEGGDPRFEHVYGATAENELIPSVLEFPRFNKEMRIIMEKSGRIDPEDIYDYINQGGYSALVKALQRGPDEIIHILKESGLRGRGGAGFPTGAKWEAARQATAKRKFLICNADEGDPGAYMDRALLESNPHQIIEGMAICAYAVGIEKAVVYVRAEYPLAVKIISHAIKQAKELGLLGQQILGAAFDLEMEVFQGSGAFVCGEETALIQSLEGRRGMPRHRPPYPARKGLGGRPTVINNVKTLAAVSAIIQKGAAWFKGIGTAASSGTAIFSIVGDIIHPGLVEICMGVSLRELIFDICGGIPNQKEFKAVQIGGPSGGCLPAQFLDTPVDFDSLKAAGAMMGSGGMVVMDTDTCMVDVARYFLDFTQKESCGKCTFCRVGTYHLLTILKRITQGEGVLEDLAQLEALSREIQDGSLCGLGKTAPNPVLTSLRYFKDEYMAHIMEKRCPAGSCRTLTAFYIDLDKCARGCDICGGCCPVDAVFTTKNRKKGIDPEICVKCGECMAACPPDYNAVCKISPAHLAPKVARMEEKQIDGG